MAVKQDEPSLRMQIEPGRMIPADPYSEEALNVFPLGSVVTCRIGPDMTTPKRIRYRSILSRAVKQFSTPWKNGRQADWTMKLALGVTDEAAQLNGTKVHFPGSTTSLTESEFDQFYSGAMAILRKIIGVDPESLEKTPPQPQESASAGSSQPEVGDDDRSEDVSSAAPPPPVIEKPLAPRPAAGATQARESIEREAVRKLIALATDDALGVPERLEELDLQRGFWADAVPPERRAFISTITTQAARVARGELGARSAEEYLLGLAKEGG